MEHRLPKLNPGQYYIGFIATDTGRLAMRDGKVWNGRLHPASERFTICDSIEQAEMKAEDVIRSIPGLSAVIYDSTHKGVCELPNYPRPK